MAQILKLRRSAIAGAKPTTAQIEFGEVAMNTADGKLFMKISGSTGVSVIEIGANASTGNVSGSINYIPVFTGANSVGTSSIFQSGSFTSIRKTTSPLDPNNPDILFVSGDGIPSYNLISAHGNMDNYVQVNVQNYSSGSSASSDIVATANDGDENSKFIDMGINSSGYTNTNFVGTAGDAYVYSTGNNLYIGNATPDKQVVIFNGSLDAAASARVWVFDQGTVGINTDDYNTVNPPSLVVKAPNTTTNTLIEAEGETNQFLQLAIANNSPGALASSDIVAYNNLDPTNQGFGFIDMGINSTNYNDPTNFPGWTAGHSYLYTDAPGLKIGSTSGSSQINMFVGGTNPITNSKLVIRANNLHSMTGSLSVSGSITGSLFGTASWAQNAITASHALTASSADNFLVRGTLTAQTIVVQTITASVEFVTGSTKFGSIVTNTHQFTGSVSISGSLSINGTSYTAATSGTSGTAGSSGSSGSSGSTGSSGSSDPPDQLVAQGQRVQAVLQVLVDHQEVQVLVAVQVQLAHLVVVVPQEPPDLLVHLEVQVLQV